MRVDTLPSPGMLSMGIELRTCAARAVSSVEINAGISVNGGKSSQAKPLADFFTACIAAISGMYDVTVPAVTARNILASAPNKVRVLYNDGLNPGNKPPTSAFVLATPTKVISKVELDGPYVILTVTVPYVAGDTGPTVAYTQPGTTFDLRDSAGNLAASFTAAAVVNSIV